MRPWMFTVTPLTMLCAPTSACPNSRGRSGERRARSARSLLDDESERVWRKRLREDPNTHDLWVFMFVRV